MYAHLHTHSPFSFLDGAASMESLLTRAAEIGCRALAVTDHNNLSVTVRFHKLAAEIGIKPIQGCEITIDNGCHLTLLCQNRTGYANLCRLVTRAHLDAPRGLPQVSRRLLEEHSEGLIALSGCRHGEVAALMLQGQNRQALEAASAYASAFPGRFYIEVQDNLLPRTRSLNRHLRDLAEYLDLPMVATANVHYAYKEQFPVHDILTCVRTLTCLQSIHPARRLNAENYLLTSEEMADRFRDFPQALRGTLEIADLCETAIPLGERLFPFFNTPDGSSAIQFLRQLTFQGAQERYGSVTAAIRERLEHELRIIAALDVADYFLVAWDVARFARERGICYAGRGSAADSAVVYCLYITNVDAISRGLLFERFLSLERAQQPDIDIDFDARYRDDIARYVYAKYGEDHVASVCTYHTYHARSALRDFGKAMGLPLQEVEKVAKAFPHVPADGIRKALIRYPELQNSGLSFERYEKLFDLVEQVAGFPRHIGTHLGGLVISNRPLVEVSPLQMAAKGMRIIQFDKDDIEELGLMKLDLLSLRTLSAVQTAIKDINTKQTATGEPLVEYATIPLDDAYTYAALNHGESIGAFQLESPAQRALQSRLGAENIEDIVASIALIRPGPIQGNMVEPFIAYRNGHCAVSYVHPDLEPILAKTYGVVLFQEQVIEIAVKIAGFSPGEADQLRKAMTHFRSQKKMDQLGREFIAKATKRGVDQEVAETLYSYIVSYAGYGFCEAHAAAFSDTAYKTAYLVTHYPAEFFAAILSHQPMGYYPPATIVAEAKRRGVRILPPDVNRSGLRFTVENGAIRVSLTQVKGSSPAIARSVISSRAESPFQSFRDFCRRVHLPRDVIKNLIQAGAFDTLYANRRQLLWQLQETLAMSGEKGQPALPFGSERGEIRQELSDYPAFEKAIHEVTLLGFSPEKHLMQFFRPQLVQRGIKTCGEISSGHVEGAVGVAGIVIRPHRPPTKSGRTVVFLGLEDEFGLCDITIFEDVYKRYAREIFHSPALTVWGRISRRGKGISVIADRVKPLLIG
ncbi:MAG: DNA polymerase III subunit alpha [Limnochordia bacterium]